MENTYGWLLLYVLEALVFQNNSKWILSSLSNRAIFYWEYFHLKSHPKKHVPSFSLPWWKGILVFFITFYAVTLQTLFFTGETKRFDFFKTTLSTLNIIYINIIYNIYILYTEKAHLGLHSNNETAVLKTKSISRSLLKNLISQKVALK